MTRVNKSKDKRIGSEPQLMGNLSGPIVKVIKPSMSMTKPELTQIAQEAGIEVKRQTKTQLLEAIKAKIVI